MRRISWIQSSAFFEKGKGVEGSTTKGFLENLFVRSAGLGVFHMF